MLDARQLGLKLIANVTYGYTSASFSGRMPCADIADAIVQTGRDTLQRVRASHPRRGHPPWIGLTWFPLRDATGRRRGQAMQTIEREFPARVVYGDTDRSAAGRAPPWLPDIASRADALHRFSGDRAGPRAVFLYCSRACRTRTPLWPGRPWPTA